MESLIECTVLEDLYNDGTVIIRFHTDTTNVPVDTTQSSKLFTACLDKIFKKLKQRNILKKEPNSYVSKF